MTARRTVAAAVVLTGLVAVSGCAARSRLPAPPPPSPSPTARSSAATVVVPVGVRPFGLPVDIGPASVVVRAIRTFRPDPPLPGRAGTPVRAEVVINLPAGPRPSLRADLRDPQTGRLCIQRLGPDGRPPELTPGQTTHVGFSFLCPEAVRSDLVVTVAVGVEHQAFLGPLG